MRVFTFKDVDWSCVRLWYSRAYTNVVGVRANADTVEVTEKRITAKWVATVVSAANAGTPDDMTMQDMDALSKIEAFYHASETNDPDNNTSFKY